MSSSMALWDYATPYFPADYLRQRPRAALTCERCGCEIPPAKNWNSAAEPKRFCSETCRKRATRARWKARWKTRGVNKYIGGRSKDE